MATPSYKEVFNAALHLEPKERLRECIARKRKEGALVLQNSASSLDKRSKNCPCSY